MVFQPPQRAPFGFAQGRLPQRSFGAPVDHPQQRGSKRGHAATPGAHPYSIMRNEYTLPVEPAAFVDATAPGGINAYSPVFTSEGSFTR